MHLRPTSNTSSTCALVEQTSRAPCTHGVSYGCSADARELVQGCLADRPLQRLDARGALGLRWLAAEAPDAALLAPGGGRRPRSPGTTVV